MALTRLSITWQLARGWLLRPFRRWGPFPLPDPQKVPIGRYGEVVAANYLAQRRYRILARNVSNRFGEIDLVALQGRTVVLVEVKTWAEATARGEDPSLAVDSEKTRALTRAALAFLKQHRLLESPVRIDVVSVVVSAHGNDVRHFQNAIEPPEEGQWFS